VRNFKQERFILSDHHDVWNADAILREATIVPRAESVRLRFITNHDGGAQDSTVRAGKNECAAHNGLQTFRQQLDIKHLKAVVTIYAPNSWTFIISVLRCTFRFHVIIKTNNHYFAAFWGRNWIVKHFHEHRVSNGQQYLTFIIAACDMLSAVSQQYL
jgi:hypothetical protein